METRRRTSVAATIAGVYLVFSVLWIVVSDRALRSAYPDGDTVWWFQTIKGLAFVVASASLVFVVAHRYLDRAQRTARLLAEAYDQTLAGWAAALDSRDHSTGEHTARVTALTVALAERFGISGADLDDIRRGATLHDIGKMAVPDRVLGKTQALDEDDWAQIRQHPDTALRMLDGIAFLEGALAIPGCHHERWDGSGYPRGLAGEQIPFPARVFAVVDVYDAVTSDRPYREPMLVGAALSLIESGSGTLFDPEVVVEFTAMMRERQAAGLLDEGGRF